MSHDLETAHTLLDHHIDEGIKNYFDFLEHQLTEAITKTKQHRDRFKASKDYHEIKEMVTFLSHLDLGFERAIVITNRVATSQEEIIVLEDIERDEGC